MPEVNKEQSVEIQNESSPTANIYEFNSFVSPMDISSLFSCGIYDYFSKEEIDSILRDPIGNHDTAIRYQILYIQKMVSCLTQSII